MPSARRVAPRADTCWLKPRKACAALRTDYIDLYQIHYPDPKTPIEETLRALDDLVKSGKVRSYVGCSNFSATQLQQAEDTAGKQSVKRFISSQDEYSLLVRDIEREQLPLIEHLGMSELPYFPLASGLLTGKCTRDTRRRRARGSREASLG